MATLLLEAQPVDVRRTTPAGNPPGRASWGIEALLTLLAGAVAVGFCGVLLLHDAHWFWHDYYQTYQLANYRDVARAWQQGEVPLLSPYSWHGGALAAEYQNGVFSVFLTACALLTAELSLPKGQSGQLVLEYRPRSLIVGVWLAGATGLVVLLLFVLSVLSRKSGRSPERATEYAP